jgi:septal ring factor EnvC (AmiA/AmiB activator)
MNQPINTQFEELKKRVERLEQQQTEPIKVTIERRQTETERILDNHTEMLKEISTEQDSQSDLLQTIFNMAGTQNTDTAVLKHEMQGARADITSIRATQSDHGELLREHSKHFDKLEATQSEQGEKLDLILQLLQKKG